MQVKRKQRRKYAAPIGGLFVLLAVIGVAAVVIVSINLTSRVLDNSGEKEQLKELLTPMVMFDPVPFDTPADIEPTNMLLYCMWANLGSERRLTYTYNESGMLVVPASDLEVSARRLFGPEVQLEHQGFAVFVDGEIVSYLYDEKNNIYTVPVGSVLYVYLPEVLEIERAARDLYNVTVGYQSPSGNAWDDSFIAGSGSYTKTMVYVMRREGRNYYITSLRDVALEQQFADPGTVYPGDNEENNSESVEAQ